MCPLPPLNVATATADALLLLPGVSAGMDADDAVAVQLGMAGGATALTETQKAYKDAIKHKLAEVRCCCGQWRSAHGQQMWVIASTLLPTAACRGAEG